MNDGHCVPNAATVAGDTTIDTLTVTTDSGKQINLAAGLTHTINTALTLAGSSGNLLELRSTTPGSPSLTSS